MNVTPMYHDYSLSLHKCTIMEYNGDSLNGVAIVSSTFVSNVLYGLKYKYCHSCLIRALYEFTSCMVPYSLLV